VAKIIVFTQTYNAEKTLKRAINSICGQTFSDWEYYIYNNGSTDGTDRILADYVNEPRITVAVSGVNDLVASKKYLTGVLNRTDAKWFCWLDADDAYHASFLENMYAFVTNNKLDLAACGYEMIDGVTGTCLKEKTVAENLILTGEDFVNKFVEYRSFTLSLWSKLLRVQCTGEILTDDGVWENFSDSHIILAAFSKAERAGILSGIGYKYYRYPNSTSHVLNENRYSWDMSYFRFLRAYLYEQYGKRVKCEKGESRIVGTISRTNTAFLFVVLLSLVRESFMLVRESGESRSDKIALLHRYFNDEDVRELFRIDADPQFHNLAARADFVQEILDWLLVQTPGDETMDEAIKRLTQLLKSVLENIPQKNTDHPI
jgi:glycosyltransferase involved in cell wall biosynthesis